MEKFKNIEELFEPDPRNRFFHVTLEWLHKTVSAENITDNAPNDIKRKFNVLKNITVYTWYCYDFHPVAQLQALILIEYALKIKAEAENKSHYMLAKLIKLAIKRGWIVDSGFRNHCDDGNSTDYCNRLIVFLPSFRNSYAHGEKLLVPHSVQILRICTDLINQLFKENTIHPTEVSTDVNKLI